MCFFVCKTTIQRRLLVNMLLMPILAEEFKALLPAVPEKRENNWLL